MSEKEENVEEVVVKNKRYLSPTQKYAPPGRCRVCRGTGRDVVQLEIEQYEKENHIKRNRKRMAWIALISCLAVVLLMMFVVEETRIDLLADVMTWFFLIMGSIVGTYIGFSSIAVAGKGRFTRNR